MKSKTLISKQSERKRNPELVETIRIAKKHGWTEVAGFLSTPKRKWAEINLEKINKESREGETVLVPGKVLSQGEVEKKLKVIAFSFSEKALEKLKKAGCATLSIKEGIKSNPDGKGMKILK